MTLIKAYCVWSISCLLICVLFSSTRISILSSHQRYVCTYDDPKGDPALIHVWMWRSPTQSQWPNDDHSLIAVLTRSRLCRENVFFWSVAWEVGEWWVRDVNAVGKELFCDLNLAEHNRALNCCLFCLWWCERWCGKEVYCDLNHGGAGWALNVALFVGRLPHCKWAWCKIWTPLCR